ncbi:MAG TPA: cytochrome c-type biogenesis CcmF C-terminal domain-containing protein, partial [Pyrinomonadaceae bacterium]|nr:cytochrome c-type biogenesis CcmF C-terminal domain-containing protein [Pyrinomonadaceae bacterium]
VGLGGKFELISRESFLLSNNVLLIVAAASVLLGTLYPIFADALGWGRLSVGPPYFNAVFVPLMAPVAFMIGVGPVARWKRQTLPELAVRLRWAFLVSVVTAVLLPFAVGEWQVKVSFGLLLAAWIIATVFTNIWTRARGEGGFVKRLAAQSRSYYGMELAHLGVAVFIIGVTLVTGYEERKDVRMNVGDTTTVGGYVFRFDGVSQVAGPNYVAARGEVAVSKGGEALRTMYPEKRKYVSSEQTMTEADIATGLTRDLYVSLGEPVSGGAWSVSIFYKPFVDWIWGGAALMALGGMLAVSDRRYRVAVRERRRAAKSGKSEPEEAKPATAPALVRATTEES